MCRVGLHVLIPAPPRVYTLTPWPCLTAVASAQFFYTGETIKAGDSDDVKTEEVFQVRGEKSRLSNGRVRHGHGDITYDSGSQYVGQWRRDKRDGTGKYIFACGVSLRASIHATMSSRLRKEPPCAHCLRAPRWSSTLAGCVRRSVERRSLPRPWKLHERGERLVRG